MTSNRYIPVKSTFGWGHALWGRVNSLNRGRIVCCIPAVKALHKFDCRFVMNWIHDEWRPVGSDRVSCVGEADYCFCASFAHRLQTAIIVGRAKVLLPNNEHELSSECCWSKKGLRYLFLSVSRSCLWTFGRPLCREMAQLLGLSTQENKNREDRHNLRSEWNSNSCFSCLSGIIQYIHTHVHWLMKILGVPVLMVILMQDWDVIHSL